MITFTISWIEVFFIARSPDGINSPARAFALMWTPGLVGLGLSWLFGWRFRDIGFQVGNWRYYAWSYAVPALTAFLILFTLIATGIGDFEINPKLLSRLGSISRVLAEVLVLAPVVGTFFGFISGLGEELGWRGFLHSKLMELNVPHSFLITGVIWAVWHWPLILFSNYAPSGNTFFSIVMFSIMAISASVFMGLVRERSGSVLTAGLFHGSHNLWIQGIYPAFLKKGPLDSYFGGEFGVLNALLYGILAAALYQKCFVRGRPIQVSSAREEN